MNIYEGKGWILVQDENIWPLLLTINQYAIGILAVEERNGGTAKPV